MDEVEKASLIAGNNRFDNDANEADNASDDSLYDVSGSVFLYLQLHHGHTDLMFRRQYYVQLSGMKDGMKLGSVFSTSMLGRMPLCGKTLTSHMCRMNQILMRMAVRTNLQKRSKETRRNDRNMTATR